MGTTPSREDQIEIVLDAALVAEPRSKALKVDPPRQDLIYASYGAMLSRSHGNTLYTLVQLAYARHLPIHLHPEDFLLALDSIVSQTVDADPERFRPLFVDHAGKKTLELAVEPGTPWDERVAGLTQVACDAVKDPAFAAHMMCDFSASTALDRVVSATYVLNTVKHYFDFKIEVSCGIPRVYLHGTVRDYERLLEKTRALGRFLGEPFFEEQLAPIFEGLIEQRRGTGAKDFWDKMINEKPGGYNTVWNGWIMTLYPTIHARDGTIRFIVKPNNAGEYDACLSRVPVELVENGKVTHVYIRGGPVGVSQDRADGSLRIVRGYHVEERDEAAEARRDLHRKLTCDLAELIDTPPGFHLLFQEYKRRKAKLHELRVAFSEQPGVKRVEVSLIDEFLEKNLETPADDAFFHEHASVRLWCDPSATTEVSATMARTGFRFVKII